MNNNALNFSYLLLDYYKDMNLSEHELAIILMLDHLINNGNDFITNELLSLKMNLSSVEIDNCMTNLYKRKYVEFIIKDNETKTSIEPIKRIVAKKFERELYSEEAMKNDEDLLNLRNELCTLFEETFKRELNPLELEHINEWINNEISGDIIKNSLKDAKNLNKLNFTTIDSIIIKKINERKGN